MRLFLTFLMLLLPVLTAGCGDGDTTSRVEDDLESSEPATVVLHPVELDGGMFVEGFVAAYEVDADEPTSLAGREYREPVEVDLDPGQHELLVTVLPCEAACMRWERTRELIEQQQTRGRSNLANQLTRCRTQLDVSQGSTVELTPVISTGPLDELTPDGLPCRIVEAAREPGDTMMRGAVIARDGDVAICTEGMFMSDPPSCGDPSPRFGTYRVENLDTDVIDTRDDGGVRWAEDVTLWGHVKGDTFVVAE